MSEVAANELIALGGTWNGVLFENPATGYPLALTWSCSIDFAPLERPYGSTEPGISIDWLPARTAEWRRLAGLSFTGTTFADPIESSIYVFAHHRYDAVDLVVGRQVDQAIDVSVSLRGDIDGLGLPEVAVRSTVAFGGIFVQCSESGTDPDAAARVLSRFCSLDGLEPRTQPHNVVFEPQP
jgi:hypothetical protein